MKLFIATLAVTVGAASACTFTGSCTKANMESQGCSAVAPFTPQQIQAACDAAAYSFGDVTKRYYQFDNNFLDGDGSYNDSPESSVTTDFEAGRVLRFQENAAGRQRVQWPEYEALQDYTTQNGGTTPYIDNLDLDNSCDLRTVMCCFTDSRQATISTNAQVCSHDLGTSRRTNHVANGFGRYDGGSAYCVGFAWESDEGSTSAQYKGNSLFNAAFGTFLELGYTKNIPGAPMCGCVENMPKVTTAACQQVSVTNEAYTVELSNSALIVTQTSADVTFSSCGSDLAAHYQSSNIGTPEEAAKLRANHLVGGSSCDNTEFLNSNFYVADANAAAIYQEPPASQWRKVAGQGLLYFPTKTYDLTQRDVDFRALFDASPNKIVRRLCTSCIKSHRDIYYRRLTPVPDNINFLDLFLNNWVSANNELGVDFNLYSTYEEAVAGNGGEWQFCNYDEENYGFPLDCDPVEWAGCQWNSYIEYPCWGREYNGASNGFYVEL